MSSPTQRTLAYCRSRRIYVCIVEKWVAQARKRIDAFGFGDLLALDTMHGAVLLQACSACDISKRVEKIQTECEAAASAWLARGNRIYVIGWAKRGKAGAIKKWKARIVELLLDERGAITAEQRAGLHGEAR